MTQDDTSVGDSAAQVAALTGVLRPLLASLEALAFVARQLHPPRLDALVAEVGDVDTDLRAGLAAFRAMDWPDELAGAVQRVEAAGDQTCRAFDELRQATAGDDAVIAAYRALRRAPRAQEALYPLSRALRPVSQFFLEDSARDDEALLSRLKDAQATATDVGPMHADNAYDSRGGFSVYVPEYYDADAAWPLIVALHGGSGHGRGFLWTWLRAARSRGAILLSPTARGDTWSLMGPDVDSENIAAMLDYVGERWNVDARKLLLTGMSDGGTFAYVSGLRANSPFTHLAPIAASFHPMLMEMMDAPRIAGLPIYLTHGALDWMFNIEIARSARSALRTAGADVTYREIADLSHTYPREENARILDWFLGGPTASA